MPATNRHGRLIPAPADTYSSTSGDYLRSQLPSWASFQTALALLALLLIVRSVVRRGSSCFSLRDRLQSPTRPAAGLLGQQSHQPCAAQQHQRLQPWAMEDEKTARERGIVSGIKRHHVRFDAEEPVGSKKTTLAIDPTWRSTTTAGATVPEPFIMSRPPPAPPLTPPELSTAVFTFLDRPHSSPESFIHQPNPDYMSSSSISTMSLSQSSTASPSTPRRRSYNKTLPIGIPVPQHLSAGDADPADLTLSPSSYPPTSPLLPPAPPGLQVQYGDEDSRRQVGMHGEIIGVLNDEGAGWTRHTRVYGGGVCLACAASGGNHLEGGFYGATVSPEEMR